MGGWLPQLPWPRSDANIRRSQPEPYFTLEVTWSRPTELTHLAAPARPYWSIATRPDRTVERLAVTHKMQQQAVFHFPNRA